MSAEKLKIVDLIRNRPGMFVGELSFRGVKAMIAFMLEEILEVNPGSVEIFIEFKEEEWISIKADHIEPTLFLEVIRTLDEECKFINYGLPVVVALSEEAEIKINEVPSLVVLRSKSGVYQSAATTARTKTKSIEINFKIDKSIFKDTVLSYEIMNQMIRKYAFVNTNCRIISKSSTTSPGQIILFDYPRGIAHELDYKLSEQMYSTPLFRMDLNTKIGDYEYQVSFAYAQHWTGENNYIMTYANYTELIFGGSLEKGIIEGFKEAIKQYALQEQIPVSISTNKIKDHLYLLAVARGKDFEYRGATKLELNMPVIRKEIRQFITSQVVHYLMENNAIGQKVLDKFEKVA